MPNSPESETSAQQPQATDGGQEVPQRGLREDELTAELARMEDRYKRALADLDNYRKRSQREIERRVTEVRGSVLSDWLDAVDSVERAVRLAPEPCVDGMRAVLDQMDAILAREGVQRLGAAGDQFDPGRHEAIAVEPSDRVPDRTILAVERSGYALGDRVIRPAQVIVARAPEPAH
jgi:molecular chaperone GrpE